MAASNDQLVPGDIVQFDFQLATENSTVAGLAVHNVKQAIWADDRYDYQGSEEKTETDPETGQTSRILSIYAMVRKTRREQRGKIEYASLSSFEAYVKAAVVVWGEQVRWVKTKVARVEQVMEAVATAGAKALPAISGAVLLIAAVVFYTYFLGGPKRGH